MGKLMTPKPVSPPAPNPPLNLPTPAYAHHGLIVGADGKKFSKRDKAPTLRALRDAGKSPADVRAMLGNEFVPGLGQ